MCEWVAERPTLAMPISSFHFFLFFPLSLSCITKVQKFLQLTKICPLYHTMTIAACIPFPLSATADPNGGCLWTLTMQEVSVYGRHSGWRLPTYFRAADLALSKFAFAASGLLMVKL